MEIDRIFTYEYKIKGEWNENYYKYLFIHRNGL